MNVIETPLVASEREALAKWAADLDAERPEDYCFIVLIYSALWNLERTEAVLREGVDEYLEHQSWRCGHPDRWPWDPDCQCGLVEFEKRARKLLNDASPAETGPTRNAHGDRQGKPNG